MPAPLLLRQVNLLEGPNSPERRADVLLEGQRLGEILGSPGAGESPSPATAAGLPIPIELEASHLWLGPALVDPHSVLEDPWLGRAETLTSLADAARSGGYGTVALLPWARPWRDRPESLMLAWPEPLRLLLWGAFSHGGEERDLADHADQLAAGACGLAGTSTLPPLALLERGLRLGETGRHPVLVAPRDFSLTQQGFVRERVEGLRGGWPVDPESSELLPLQSLLTLADALPDASLRLMNLSTAEGVERLRQRRGQPQASVGWWHLLADSGSLDPAAEGWRMVPSLGGPADREALIAGLADGTLSAVAVHHEALDAEERLLPLDQRRPGLAGHGLVLPLLWDALVAGGTWSARQLWQVLCWGPCGFLELPPSRLEAGSSDWLLFDPAAPGRFTPCHDHSLAANRSEPPPGGFTARVVGSRLLTLKEWSAWVPL